MAPALSRREAATAALPWSGRAPADNPLVRLGRQWSVLKHLRVAVGGEAASLDLVILHPDYGIALIAVGRALALRETAIAVVRSALGADGFGERFPGFLPVVFLDVTAEQFRRLPSLLTEAFAGEPDIEPSGPGWPGAAVDALRRHSLDEAGDARQPDRPNPAEGAPTFRPPRPRAGAVLALGAAGVLAATTALGLLSFHGDGALARSTASRNGIVAANAPADPPPPLVAADAPPAPAPSGEPIEATPATTPAENAGPIVASAPSPGEPDDVAPPAEAAEGAAPIVASAPLATEPDGASPPAEPAGAAARPAPPSAVADAVNPAVGYAAAGAAAFLSRLATADDRAPAAEPAAADVPEPPSERAEIAPLEAPAVPAPPPKRSRIAKVKRAPRAAEPAPAPPQQVAQFVEPPRAAEQRTMPSWIAPPPPLPGADR